MTIIKTNIVIIVLLVLISCSIKDNAYYKIDPNDYVFKTEYRNKLWKYYLHINDCDKINFIDSIYSAELIERDSIIYYGKSHDSYVNKLDTNLYDRSIYFERNENFYYWMFRYMYELPLNSYWKHIDNIPTQTAPPFECYQEFQENLDNWREILNCDKPTFKKKD